VLGELARLVVHNATLRAAPLSDDLFPSASCWNGEPTTWLLSAHSMASAGSASGPAVRASLPPCCWDSLAAGARRFRRLTDETPTCRGRLPALPPVPPRCLTFMSQARPPPVRLDFLSLTWY
jgi:hypothetical protein